MDHLMAKLGLSGKCTDTTQPTYSKGGEEAKKDMGKLGLKKGGHAKKKSSCHKKMAMGGVAKERLGMD